MPISRGAVIVASLDQVSCDLAGEAAILHLKSGVYYGLNAVGARIWQLIREPRALLDLESLLASEYDVDPSRCTADLSAFIEELAAANLVVFRT